MAMPSRPSPLALPVVRRFVAFRVFFNARFYYPVFTILFLDLGLSLEHFALLNAAWAATIVALEVPSGALADAVGRARLLVAAGVLMVLEMSLLCAATWAPQEWLFGLLLLNRVVSGSAEAAASGADEALAFEALRRHGRGEEWGTVLIFQARCQSLAFVLAMGVGAALYDADLLNRLAEAAGGVWRFTPAETLRYPVLLTLAMAFAALTAARSLAGAAGEAGPLPGPPAGETLRLVGIAVDWIRRTPMGVAVILAGLLFDHVLRMLLTLNSQYLRQIGLPEGSFGLIGAALALMGLVVPRGAEGMTRRWSPLTNLLILAAAAYAGLLGLTRFWPVAGLLPLALLYAVMLAANHLVSRYLHRLAPASQRATILSIKGLCFNLGYGLMGILYAGLLAGLERSGVPGGAAPEAVFASAMNWFPGYFLCGLGAVLLAARLRSRAAGPDPSPGADDARRRGRRL